MEAQSPWKVHLLRSEGYLELGMVEDAANELESMPAEDRARPKVIGFRVKIYFKAEHWELAAVTAKHMTRIAPKNPEWWIDLAYAVRRSESIEAAEKVAIVALTHHPENGALWYRLACCEAMTGRIEDAKHHVADAIGYDGSLRGVALYEPDLKPIWDAVEAIE